MPAAVCVVGFLLAVGAWALLISPILSGNVQPNAVLPDFMDSNRAAVHKWIDENANDGNWQEVRWWKAKVLVQKKKNDIASKQKTIDQLKAESMRFPKDRRGAYQQTIDYHESVLLKMKAAEPERACRIKWREKSPLGGPILHDNIFLFDHGQAMPVKDSNEFDRMKLDGYREYFMDGQKVNGDERPSA